MRLNSLILLTVTASVVAATGCSSTINLTPWRDRLPKSSQADPVVEILGLWQPAEGTGLDGLPARGFAGQLLFFNRGSKMPVKVDGDIRIYVFDDYGDIDQQSTPIDQFDFVEDTWQAHLHVGTLGPSYNVFIPYSRKSNKNQAKCSLRIRLQPEDGPVIFSEMVTVTLPGPISEEMRRRSEERSQKIEHRVQETLGKLTEEQEAQRIVNQEKSSKFSTIALQTSRDASGRSVTRIADAPKVASVDATDHKDSSRMSQLEKKMDQLVELMANQQQPADAPRDRFDRNTATTAPIEQASATVERPETPQHPLSFRVKPRMPLAASTTSNDNLREPQSTAGDATHPFAAPAQPYGSSPQILDDFDRATQSSASTNPHPLGDDRGGELWNTVPFDGPETSSPPSTFGEHLEGRR